MMKLSSSFRDPSGFVYRKDGEVYRQVNPVYKEDYDSFLNSGLYELLASKKLLIPHEEVSLDLRFDDTAYKVLKPEIVPFISYPYEWCFSQLKDAALALLQIQQLALEHGFVLKDASAYNMQFYRGHVALLDTLSFQKYTEGSLWQAYRQFCQHFLAPLALAAHVDYRLLGLSYKYIDGIPLDLASTLLPRKTKLFPGILMHIHMHAASQKKHERSYKEKSVRKGTVSKNGMLGMVDSLSSTISKLRIESKYQTTWEDYYDNTNYSPEGIEHKKELVEKWLREETPSMVWDLGANDGLFTAIAAKYSDITVGLDNDFMSVEGNYHRCKELNITNWTSLLLDLANPSARIGWDLAERDSFKDRGPADMVLALALVHHIAIGNNVPLDLLVKFLSEITNGLIIEFVPKEDSQVQKLLSTREDIFSHYTKQAFETALEKCFIIRTCQEIKTTKRHLYLLRKK
jgi:hypothetical protein